MLSKEDHEKRKRFIGASEIGAICGLDEYRTPYDVWALKTGRAEPTPDTPETHRGKALEPAIRLMFAQESGYEVEDWNTHIVHANGYCACTPDGYFYRDGKRIGLEIKSFVGYYDENSIVDRHMSAILQCQWSMWVVGLETWVLAWFDSSFAVQWKEIERNEGLIEMLKQTAENFWLNHVLADVPPDAIRPSDFAQMPILEGYFEAGETVKGLVSEYRELNASISMLETHKAEIADRLKMIIGQSEGIKAGNRKLASWKADKNGNRIFRTYGKRIDI